MVLSSAAQQEVENISANVKKRKKYSSDSALNMFDEFTFLKDRTFDEYFGFTENEVIKLCNKNKNISFKELKSWYNGYLTAK